VRSESKFVSEMEGETASARHRGKAKTIEE